MKAHTFTYSTTCKALEVNPFFMDNALEKNAPSEKNRVSWYRYGFNGKEKDDEISGKGNQYDYGFRIYNPRLGRFLSTDPLFKNYPMLTTYQFASNTPIRAIDLDGLEAISVEGYIEKGVVISVTQNFDLDGEDARIHYRIHNMSTGSTEDLWVHPTEIKYEPSAGERFMTGVRDAGEYASSKFKSLDQIMKDKARGRPTYEGVDGMIQFGSGAQDVGDAIVAAGVLSSETGVGALLIPIGGVISFTGSAYQGIGEAAKGDVVGATVTGAAAIIPYYGGKRLKSAVKKEFKSLSDAGVDKKFAESSSKYIQSRIDGLETAAGRVISQAGNDEEEK